MNISHWLYQAARSWPGRPAIYSGTTLANDYAGLLADTCGWADRLEGTHGVRAGDRVAIYSKNMPQYIAVLHACWWIGAVAVPINAKLHPREAEWIVEDSGAKVVITGEGACVPDPAPVGVVECAMSVGPASATAVRPPVAREADDLAWLFYTSGTTGRPKGVMLSHANLVSMTLSYCMDVNAPLPGDHMVYAAPLSHGAGLYMFAQIRAAGAHVVPASSGFDGDEIIALARHHGGLVFFAAPTMVKRLVDRSRICGFDGEGIRTIVYGGGPMYRSDIEDALDLYGPRFVQIYGQGETPMTITVLSRDLVADRTHPRADARRASVGCAQGCVRVATVDGTGRAVAAGTVGEVAVKGATVMLGYWNNPDATAETVKDGWLHTGDLGYLDGDGFLHLTDRLKDVVISGGTNIYPREVEDALLDHSGVFEVSVIGMPDPDWGERVVACVVARPGHELTEGDLDGWCRGRMAAFKCPKQYRFLTDLPKNNYGKIMKTALRDPDGGGA